MLRTGVVAFYALQNAMSQEIVAVPPSSMVEVAEREKPFRGRTSLSFTALAVATLEVRWMFSGERVCTVEVTEREGLEGVKTQIEKVAGIHASELQLFLHDDEELVCSAILLNAVSTMDRGCVLKLVRSRVNPLQTNLNSLRSTATSFRPLPAGEFTEVRKLANGINGDVFMYRRQRDGEESETCAVKKIGQHRLACMKGTETDERKVHLRLGSKKLPMEEDALTEIGVLEALAKRADMPKYLLQLQGLFVGDGSVWVVTELADGGDLFTEVKQHNGGLPARRAQVFSWELLQAVEYLHRHQIGHRDLSLENVLLKDGCVRLMDFGAAVRTSTPAGEPLRYFRGVGKNFYRAPECYVPTTAEAEVTVPAGAGPGDIVVATVNQIHPLEVRLPEDAVEGEKCSAELYGYAVCPADIWSAAICVFMMHTGVPAWGKADLSDGIFAYVRRNTLAALLQAWGKPALPAEAQELIDSMLAAQPSQRPEAAECLEASWFSGLREQQVSSQ